MEKIRWRTALALVAAALLSGCAFTTSRDSLPPSDLEPSPDYEGELANARQAITALQQEKARLEKRLRTAQRRNRELKLELLDKTAQMHQLETQREKAIEEAVQTKARLRSRHSRAEAVANLAEVKLTLQGAAEKNTTPESVQALAQARELIDMAEQALDEDNLEGASYLMTQARELLAASPDAGTAATGNRKGELLFPTPFPMEVRRKGNVRLGPGLQSEVLFQLDAGERVLVLGRRGTWLHIRTGDNRTGWMHFDLLENPG